MDVPNLNSRIRIQFSMSTEHLLGTVMGDPYKESFLAESLDRANRETLPERGRKILADVLQNFGVDPDAAILETGVAQGPLYHSDHDLSL